MCRKEVGSPSYSFGDRCGVHPAELDNSKVRFILGWETVSNSNFSGSLGEFISLATESSISYLLRNSVTGPIFLSSFANGGHCSRADSFYCKPLHFPLPSYSMLCIMLSASCFRSYPSDHTRILILQFWTWQQSSWKRIFGFNESQTPKCVINILIAQFSTP